jgi:hypothetical protein
MATLNEKVATWSSNRRGQFVGPRGECYDLADAALRNSSAKSAPDFCTVTPLADYVWGTPVNVIGAQRGDILQFRDYGVQQTTQTDVWRYPRFGLPVLTSSNTPDLDYSYDRPHHTAIILENHGQGTLYVAEQNAPPDNVGVPLRKVVFNVLNLWPLIWLYPAETVLDGDAWVVTYKTIE